MYACQPCLTKALLVDEDVLSTSIACRGKLVKMLITLDSTMNNIVYLDQTLHYTYLYNIVQSLVCKTVTRLC